MAVTEETVAFTTEMLDRIQQRLRESDLDGWLLYDFRGNNPIAAGVLGLPPLSRRLFVLVPAEGPPVALTHRIEQQPWRGWIGQNRVYLSWNSFESGLREMLGGSRRVAVEHSEGDAVPYVDRVPGGVLEIIRSAGVEIVSSGDLVSAFYSRWGDEGAASHRRAARVLRNTVHAAFDRIGARLRSGDTPTEWEIRGWIVDELLSRGLTMGADAIVAVDGNAANPHYVPAADGHSMIAPGCLLLIDLWGKENEGAIYADQTWMAYIGSAIPARIETLWSCVHDAREAALTSISTRHDGGEPLAGFEVDDVARSVFRQRGLEEVFIHRTGHSIDRELHGSGPNIDNLETRDTRLLIPGIGFSIEPGLYIPGEVGIRSEVDVFMAPSGPEVTTPDRQHSIHRIPLE
jgi:Xaa-Pro dipeptidase